MLKPVIEMNHEADCPPIVWRWLGSPLKLTWTGKGLKNRYHPIALAMFAADACVVKVGAESVNLILDCDT